MAAAVIALIWLGMLVGVSFLATPVKFVVHDLSLPVALQVGQATFALFSRVEWGFAASLFGVCLWMTRTRPIMLALATLVASTVLAEAAWLLPALDARVDAIVAGDQPPSSSHHTLYAALDALKAVLLATLAFLGLRRSPARSPAP